MFYLTYWEDEDKLVLKKFGSFLGFISVYRDCVRGWRGSQETFAPIHVSPVTHRVKIFKEEE